MGEKMRRVSSRLPRMWDWMAITVVLVLLVWWIAPRQLEVVAYKTLLVSLAAVMTFWIDRSLYRRLSDHIDIRMDCAIISAARVLVRGIIFLACVLGIGMGL